MVEHQITWTSELPNITVLRSLRDSYALVNFHIPQVLQYCNIQAQNGTIECKVQLVTDLPANVFALYLSSTQTNFERLRLALLENSYDFLKMRNPVNDALEKERKIQTNSSTRSFKISSSRKVRGRFVAWNPGRNPARSSKKRQVGGEAHAEPMAALH